jgi:4-aminobutyrate aminotransferase-like enzyme
VIKIRPPLVFDLEHAERLLEAAGNAVREVSIR